MKTRSTPASAAAAKTSGLRSPCGATGAASVPAVAGAALTGVGTTMTISPTPATLAGTAFMITLDG